jgi:hypothetical protein
MRYFACTVYVAIPNFEYKEWSEGSDETFNLARAVNDAGGFTPNDIKYPLITSHLVNYTEISPKMFKGGRGETITSGGGV